MVSEGQPAPASGTALPVAILARQQIVDGSIWALLFAILALVAVTEISHGGPETIVFAFLPLLVPALLAVGHFLCAAGLQRGRPSGKTLLTAFSWLGMLRIPFGTVASILTLASLRRVRRAAADATAAPLPPLGKPIAVFWSLWQLQVLVLVGLTVWINVHDATSRSGVRRTMGDMRSIASAVEAYSVDYDAYPPARSAAGLAPLISPSYIRLLPRKDGWDTDLVYQTSPDGKSYVIVSAGKDGKFEQADPWAYKKGKTLGADADIVFRDGTFLRAEEIPGSVD